MMTTKTQQIALHIPEDLFRRLEEVRQDQSDVQGRRVTQREMILFALGMFERFDRVSQVGNCGMYGSTLPFDKDVYKKAVDDYHSKHEMKETSACPVCEGTERYRQDARCRQWFCYSPKHAKFVHIGTRMSDTGWTGFQIDIDAFNAHLSPEQLLIRDGYLSDMAGGYKFFRNPVALATPYMARETANRDEAA